MPRNDDLFPSHPNLGRNLPYARVNEREVTNNLDSIENGEDFNKTSSSYVTNGGAIDHVLRDGVPVQTQDLFLAGQDTIGVNDLVWIPYNNRIPNGFSESGAAAVGKLPEGDSLFQTTEAREGGWCRRLEVPAGGGETSLNWTGGYRSAAPGGTVKCQPGDEFKFEMWAKASAPFVNGACTIFILWEDSTGTYLPGSLVASGSFLSLSWTKYTIRGTAPAGAFGAQFYFSSPGNVADAGKFIYLDTAGAIMVTKFDELSADAIRTSNYAEDAFGTPTAGAKLENQGNALKVASNNLQVGQYVIRDLLFRLLNCLDGDVTSGLSLYRGNTDYAVRGGTPYMGTEVSMTVLANSPVLTDSSVISYTVSLPAGLSGVTLNYDALRFAVVEPWTVASGGSAVSRGIRYIPLTDRSYSTNPFGNNAVYSSFVLQLPIVASPYSASGSTTKVWLRVSLAGVYGRSLEMWFPPASAGGLSVAQLTGPSGASSPAPAAGSPAPVGGYCPDPSEPISFMRAGEWREGTFGDLEIGDEWYSLDEISGEELRGEVTFLERAEDQEKQVTTLLRADSVPVDITSSVGHRILRRVNGAFGSFWYRWDPVSLLVPGDVVYGAHGPAQVVKTTPAPRGPVIKLLVEGPHTFWSRGILQHNAKAP